jgi:Lipocalin-like domain
MKGQPAMTATAADDLRAQLIGAWRLESYESRSVDGSDVIYPFGPDAQGIILYTRDGFMSTQLMRSGRKPFTGSDPHEVQDDELASAASGYLAYSGAFTITDDLQIAHHIEVSLLPNWVHETQYHVAQLKGSRLELRPPEPTLIGGELRTANLVWRRA